MRLKEAKSLPKQGPSHASMGQFVWGILFVKIHEKISKGQAREESKYDGQKLNHCGHSLLMKAVNFALFC